jgi:hypothetical protein
VQPPPGVGRRVPSRRSTGVRAPSPASVATSAESRHPGNHNAIAGRRTAPRPPPFSLISSFNRDPRPSLAAAPVDGETRWKPVGLWKRGRATSHG